MSDLKGFRVWKLKFSDEAAPHDIFIKEHSVRGESLNKPKGRTLFVLNIPPWATKDRLKESFNKIKPVKNVILQNKPSIQDEIEHNLPISKYFQTYESSKLGFRVAYVVFEKAIHLVNAMNQSREIILSNELTPIVTGIKMWVENYHASIPNRNTLDIEINTFMNKYDKEEKAKKNQTESEPDEDGWITVTNKGRNPGLPRTEKVTHKIRKRDQASKKKKQLLNFYTFQIRESKMKHLANLRQKFAEDKERITTMKNTRKFKPF